MVLLLIRVRAGLKAYRIFGKEDYPVKKRVPNRTWLF